MEKEQDKKMTKASYFLHEMKDKVRNGYTISDIEYENIHKALTIIPEEEHYRWANVLESLKKYIEKELKKEEEDEQKETEEIEEDKKFWESVDGGSTRKGRSKKSKSKKRKSKRNKRKSKRRKSNNSI